MRKILLASVILMAIFGARMGFAATQPIIYGDMVSAQQATSITVNTADRNRSRAVWIGTAADYDFSFDGTNWVELKGCTAGEVVPIQVVGARIDSGSAAPNAGDIVFLN